MSATKNIPPYMQELMSPTPPDLAVHTHFEEAELFGLFKKGDRTAVVIDGANTHTAAHELGFLIDYGKFRDLINTYCDLRYSYFMTATTTGEDANNRLQSQMSWMINNGYRIIQKPAKVQTNTQGRAVIKGNMDIEIAVCALEHCRTMDHVILLSGDGDFRSMVQALQERGQRVTVISTKMTRPKIVAAELRHQADVFIDLYDLKHLVERARTETSVESVGLSSADD